MGSANESSKEVVDLTPDDSNHIRKRARSPLSTNAIHNNNDDNNKSMKDSTRHKNKDRRPKGELTDQQQQQQQPQSAKRVLSLTDFTNDEIGYCIITGPREMPLVLLK